jgi:hypothetical protein
MCAGGGIRQRFLCRLFDHEHFDRLNSRDQFQSKLLLERLFQVLMLWVIPGIPFEINIIASGQAGLVNDRNSKLAFHETADIENHDFPIAPCATHGGVT